MNVLGKEIKSDRYNNSYKISKIGSLFTYEDHYIGFMVKEYKDDRFQTNWSHNQKCQFPSLLYFYRNELQNIKITKNL